MIEATIKVNDLQGMFIIIKEIFVMHLSFPHMNAVPVI